MAVVIHIIPCCFLLHVTPHHTIHTFITTSPCGFSIVHPKVRTYFVYTQYMAAILTSLHAGWIEAVHELNHNEIKWLKIPPGILSERQRFEADPVGMLTAIFKKNPKSSWPARIVGWSRTMKSLNEVLSARGYKEIKKIRNCLFAADGSTECSISVYERGKAPRKWIR